MKHDESQLKPLSHSGRIGIGWSNAGGEAGGLLTDSYLAADGIVNILRVLEELEDEKLHGLTFVELNACSGGLCGRHAHRGERLHRHGKDKTPDEISARVEKSSR